MFTGWGGRITTAGINCKPDGAVKWSSCTKPDDVTKHCSSTCVDDVADSRQTSHFSDRGVFYHMPPLDDVRDMALAANMAYICLHFKSSDNSVHIYHPESAIGMIQVR